MTKPNRDVTLTEVIRKGVQEGLAKVHTTLVAKVISYDDTKTTVNVQPVLKEKLGDNDYEPFSVIQGVPFVFQRWGTFVIKARPVPGQEVLLHIHEASLDEVLTSDREGIEPKDPRAFDLTDAIATHAPSRYPEANGVPEGELHIGQEDGNVAIIIKDNEVLLGGNASDGVANGSTSDTNFSDIDTRLSTNEAFLQSVATALAIPYTAAPVPAPSDTESNLIKTED